MISAGFWQGAEICGAVLLVEYVLILLPLYLIYRFASRHGYGDAD